VHCVDARYPELQALAARDYETARKLAKQFGPFTRDRATKERSLFVSTCKDLYFKNDSPFGMVQNVLTTDLNKKKGEMKVTPEMVESGVATVEAVRKLLMSKKMYRNQTMYDLFCSGVESGKIKNNDRKGPTTISKLLTISHEASIRTELWFALEKQAFRHNPSTLHIDERKAQWLKCCDYVFHDRADNEVQAALNRRGDSPAVNEGSDDDDNEEDELDTKYYN
jgi:hypothetical protein